MDVARKKPKFTRRSKYSGGGSWRGRYGKGWIGKGNMGGYARREYDVLATAATVRVPRLIVADRMLVTLPYFVSDALSISGLTGYTSFDWQTSAFDPLATTGGHQPMGMDQYQAFFKRIRVYGITGTVKIVNKTAPVASVSQPLLVGVGQQSEQGIVGGIAAWLEQPTTTKKYIGYSPDVHEFKLSLSAPKALGMTPQQYKDSVQTSALFTANPVIMAFLTVAITSAEFDKQIDFDIAFDMKLHCELGSRIQLATS